jgi:threonylcarbamoyladenosine tRNA methylthiotransferase MtaB
LHKAAIYTLGCKVNQYESEALAGLFRNEGYEVVDFNDYADVYVVNTCTVTHLGDRKSRQMIRRAVKTNPDAVVAVTGCYAQTAPGEVLEIPGVDIVVGTRDRGRLPELIKEARRSRVPINAVADIMHAAEFEELPILDYGSRTRAFIKIQEGCSNFCTYCIVPYARGPLRSRPEERVMAEAEHFIREGFKEIVLAGIHTGAYGLDRDEGRRLAGLVAKVASLPGLQRLRLSSIEPMDITFDLIDVIADNPVICRHLHIPLQSGDDNVLKKMNRHYTTFDFSRLVSTVRDRIPGVAITTDIMVGFPGETDVFFENSCRFAEAMGFSRMHVFKYSPRRGTPAAGFPGQVEAEKKEERSSRLIKLGEKMSRKFAGRFLGTTMEVLVEQRHSKRSKFYEGLTDNYLRVLLPGSEKMRGRFVPVKLEKFKGEYLVGNLNNLLSAGDMEKEFR